MVSDRVGMVGVKNALEHSAREDKVNDVLENIIIPNSPPVSSSWTKRSTFRWMLYAYFICKLNGQT